MSKGMPYMQNQAEYSRLLARVSSTLLNLKWQTNPVAATALGIHDYDHTLGDLSPEAFRQLAEEFKACRRILQAEIEPTQLDADDYTDYRIAMSLASSHIIRLECLKDWERCPSFYPERAMWGVHVLLAGEFAPIEERARSIISRMKEAPGILLAARRHLTNASRLFTKIGIQTTDGSIDFLRAAIPSLAESVPSMSVELLRVNEECMAALRDYRDWLESSLMPRARLDFAIGGDLYEQILFAEHYLTYSPWDIVRIGQGALINMQDELEEIARRIDPSASWQEIVQDMRRDHPTPDELLSAYRIAVQEAREFVRLRGLVTFPPSDSLHVRPTPEFERCIVPHVAYMPPPPFDVGGRPGHFWVTPADENQSLEDQERQLQRHSRYSIPITALHESYPGHHLQFSIGNRIGRPMRRQSVSHLFAEGWALYCEQMMYEQGFYSDPRVRLFQLKDSLLHACEVLVDVGLHTGEMSFHGAVGLLVETARLDEATAVADVQRHAVQPGLAMTSTIGKLLILGIREEQRRRLGSRFDIKAFHDQFLSYGTIPIPLVAQRFAEDAAWPGEEARHAA